MGHNEEHNFGKWLKSHQVAYSDVTYAGSFTKLINKSISPWTQNAVISRFLVPFFVIIIIITLCVSHDYKCIMCIKIEGSNTCCCC